MPIEKELHWTSEIMQARRVEGHISLWGILGNRQPWNSYPVTFSLKSGETTEPNI